MSAAETSAAPNTRHEVGDTLVVGVGVRRGTVVRDCDGDLWRYGRTRWLCLAPVDGDRVTRVARMDTAALVFVYGPAVVERFDR